MQIFNHPKEVQDFIKQQKLNNPSIKIGLVPTMGALHNGHLSLIQKSKEMCDITVVSIFVNPTQFGANEDFDKYPRKQKADLELCQRAGAFVFTPNVKDIYTLADDIQTKIIAPFSLSNTLEGKARNGHFNGVVQIVLKLFNIVTPDMAFFGKKDAQQLLIVEKMVEDLFLPIQIVECPIIRDENGLALSSRNDYLNEEDKKNALKISKSLMEASRIISSGERESEKIKKHALKILDGMDVEYFEIVDRNLNNIDFIQQNNTILLVVVKVNGVRLLDNLWI